MTEPWRPLGARLGTEAVDRAVLHDGVPVHLQPSLRAWLLARISSGADERRIRRVQRILRLDLSISDDPSGMYDLSDALMLVVDNSQDAFLAVVDTLLHFLDEECDVARERYKKSHDQGAQAKAIAAIQQAKDLEFMFTEAGSAYAVDIRFDAAWQIVRRVDPTARAQAEQVMASDSSAAGPLREAWTAAFRRDPDFDEAYRQAVLAVEAVVCPVAIPNDPAPTLGKAISHINDTKPKWSVAGLDTSRISSSETLLAMLRTVWHNHDRHVGQDGQPPDPVPQAEAEAVVSLAITLVQWFDRGLVSRSN
jgi:hypothetical protein